ncbi:MAG TPA: helix-turn-helix domain-containing protein [Lacisediminihabitans sp.]|uniref:TetR/AcrR family transcriptional regulator n=1 Tax=Lacisediminihabitans sp. TaxID=2787631 RepID=UPI002ED927DD
MDTSEEETPRPPRSGYANGRATREEILDRAADAFAVHGYHGASLRAIARSARIDHSTLLHHFEDKTALLLDVLQWRDESAGRILAGLPTTARDLRDEVAALLQHNRSIPGLVQLYAVLMAEAATDGHPARRFFQERTKRMAALWEDTVRRLRAESAPQDLHERVLAFLALWEGLQVFDAVHPGQLDIAHVLDGEVVRLLEA